MFPDGSLSSDDDTAVLNYNWEQIYGPSIISFTDSTLESPGVSNLEEGIYKVKLTVDDGTHSSSSSVLIIVTTNGNNNPTVTITSPSDNSSFNEGSDLSIEATASDLDGNVVLVEFYDGATKIGEDNTSPYGMVWSGASLGAHDITAKATDDNSGMTTSSIVNISVEELVSCTETGTDAQQGSFSIGYTSTFETIGTDVTITFELLDTDKTGVIAYLWQESPFMETPMDNVSGNIFSKTISSQTPGATISYACKFAFTGGLSVTNYIDYVVGSDCSGSNDTEAPTNFTASFGAISSTSLELLLNADDDFGTIVYDISYSDVNESVSGTSGVEKSTFITALSPDTEYIFTITAKDLIGNEADNSPIIISETTGPDANTECSGTSSESQQGSFEIGYNYEFETSGTDVTFTFELLDDKTGVVAYLWRENPFNETPMTNLSGKTFTVTINGQTPGAIINYACKFAFAGGLAVTKYFNYEVGAICSLGIDDNFISDIKVFPNPAERVWNIQSESQIIKSIVLFNVLGRQILVLNPNSNTTEIDATNLSKGLYFIKVNTDKGSSVLKLIKN